MARYVIIVAGGKGVRMNSDIPKQFLLLDGRPVLMRTLDAFYQASADIRIVLVLPENQFSYWENLKSQYDFTISHYLVKGGETRFHSVQNGLNAIEGDGLVAIHDGVRPLVTPHIIEQSFIAAEKHGNAIVSVPVKESLRKVQETTNEAVNRSEFRIMQTPQTFKLSVIQTAFARVTSSDFTDDASVLESTGEKIHLINGDYRNIKITTVEDLLFAEALIKA